MGVFEVRGGRVTPAKLEKKHTKYELACDVIRMQQRIENLELSLAKIEREYNLLRQQYDARVSQVHNLQALVSRLRRHSRDP